MVQSGGKARRFITGSVLFLALMGMALAQPRPVIAATEVVQSYSNILRTTETQRGRLIYTFQTVYQIAGKIVEPRIFWRQIRTGDRLQLKLENPFRVWVVKRVNLLEAQ